MTDYKLYQSSVINNNYNSFLQECKIAYTNFQREFGTNDSTWNYDRYNLFTFTAPNFMFYELFRELSTCIRDYAGHDRPIWMQSWINFHKQDEVLNWHGHSWPHHGYISVDPKKSRTCFQQWEIDNKIGQIYIGPGSEDASSEEFHHKVEVDEPYDDYRITIGFDCTETPHRCCSLHFIPIL